MAAEQIDMDAILDAALDELDDDEKSSENTPSKHYTDSNGCQESPDLASEEMDQLSDMMKEILSTTSGSDMGEAFGEVMAKVQQQMALEIEKTKKTKEAENKLKDKASTKKKNAVAAEERTTREARPVFGPEPPPRKSEVDRTISKLLDDMASATTDEEVGMDEMMKQFENLGGDDMIDGMMQQLLTKDLMYEPIKEVTAKFPKWLEDNRQVLSEEEYTK
jgi:peroxin-19